MGTGVPAGVGSVQAGLAELVSADVVGSPDALVRAEILALVAARNRLDAAISDRVATFDARQLAHADGQYNAAMWLVNFAHLSKGAAQATVARGRLLRQLPALADALRAGSISVEHVGKVAELVRHLGGVDTVQRYDGVLAALAAAARSRWARRASGSRRWRTRTGPNRTRRPTTPTGRSCWPGSGR